MGDEQSAVLFDGGIYRIEAGIECRHYSVCRPGGVPHLQPHVIPPLRVGKRSCFINNSEYVRDFR